MNVNNSLQLILKAEGLIDHKKSIKPQLLHHFVPTLWGEGVLLRSSLKGRISLFLNGKQDSKTIESKIYQQFAKALYQLNKDQQKIAKVSTQFKINLVRELSSEWNQLFEGQNCSFRSPELTQLQNSFYQKQKEERQAHLRQSLFADLEKPVSEGVIKAGPVLSDTVFSTLFDPTENDKSFDYFKDFLFRHPEFQCENFKDRLSLIDQGEKFQADINSRFQDKALPAETRHLKINGIAFYISEKLSSLSPNSKWLFCGGYGKRNLDLKSLLAFINSLPDWAKNMVPEPLSQVFTEKGLPNPRAIIENFFNESFKGLVSGPQENVNAADNTPKIAKLLFKNSVKLNELEKYVPQAVVTKINEYVQKGLLNNYLGASPNQNNGSVQLIELLTLFPTELCSPEIKFLKTLGSFIYNLTPSEQSKTFLEWISNNAGLILSPESRTEFINELKDRLITFVENESESVQSTVCTKVLQFFNNLLSPQIMQLLELAGMDDFISSGELWFEFEKQENGQFTILVYATGNALKLHPEKENKIQWPLKIQNVDGNKLDDDFFDRLLRFAIEPQFDSKAVYKAESIYEGLIPYLEGKFCVDKTTSKTPLTTKKDLVSEIISKEGRELPVFRMHCEALTYFCRPFYSSENGLEIKDERPAILLETSISKISQELEQVRHLISAEEYDRVKATEKEVRYAISRFRSSSVLLDSSQKEKLYNFPPVLADTIKTMLMSSGLKLEHINKAKNVLAWALDDNEIGHFIDAVTESINFEEAKDSAPINLDQAKRGWLQEVIKDLYLHTVLSSLNLALQIKYFAASPFSFLLIAPGIDWALRNGLPEPIFSWYVQVINTAKTKIAEWFLQLVLKVLVSKEELDNLHNMADDWKKSINQWIKNLTGNQEISFDIRPSEKVQDSLPLVTLKPRKQKGNKLKISESNKISCEISYPKVETLKATNFNEKFKEIQSHLKVLEPHPEQQLVYLLEKLKGLSIPSLSGPHEWENIDNAQIVELMDSISDCGVALQHIYAVYRNNDLNSLSNDNEILKLCYNYDFESSVILNMYSLLSILDCLARQSADSGLKDYKINSYPFLNWLKSSTIKLVSFSEHNKLEKVFSYLFPELDINNLPDPKSYSEQAKKTLFDYSWADDYSVSSFTLPVRSSLDLSVIDNPYYTEDPKEQKIYDYTKKLIRMSEMSISKLGSGKFPEYEYLSSHLKKLEKDGDPFEEDVYEYTPTQKITRLFEASLVFDGKLIPKSYSLLRLQVLLSQQMVNKSRFISKQKVKQYKLSKYRQFEQVDIWSNLASYISFRNTIRYPQPEGDLFISKYKPIFNRKIGPYFNKSLSQSGIMYNKSAYTENPDGSNNCQPWREIALDNSIILMEMIRCEPKDQIVRLISYFKDDWKRLFYQSKFTSITKRTQFIESVFFRPGYLKQQLKEYPNIAETIGEFFKDAFDFYISDNKKYYYELMWLISFGLKVKQFCVDCNPETKKHFPDFLGKLSEINAKDNYETRQFLQALALAGDEDNLSPQQKQDVVDSLLTAYYTERSSYNLIDFNTEEFKFLVLKQINSEFSQIFWKWIPAISSELKNADFRKSTLNAILAKRGAIIDPNANWNQASDFVFENDKIVVDLETPIIKGMVGVSARQVAEYKACLSDFDPKTVDLELVEQGVYETPCKQLKLHISPELECKLIKQHNETNYLCNYRVTPELIQLVSPFVTFRHYMPVYWVEETSSKIKKVLFTGADGEIIFETQVEEVGDNKFKVVEIGINNKSLHPVSYDSFKEALAPLGKFCPLDKIKCWGNAQHLSKVIIEPFKLDFDVTFSDGQYRAYNTNKFPGYSIALKQYRNYLKGFASYLLLENTQGANKVLIPSGQWMNHLAYRFIGSLGPLANLANSFIQTYSELKINTSYYTYDVVKDNQLTCEDPVGLAYLIMLYLIQDDKDRALKACEQLEMICKLKEVPKEIFSLIKPLMLVPDSVPGVSVIRQRLFAALHESALVQASKVEELSEISMLSLEKSYKDSNTDPLAGFVILRDLEKRLKQKDKSQFTDLQDWHLIKGSIQYLSLFLGDNFVRSNKWLRKANLLKIDDLVETFGFSVELQKRYRYLQNKFEPLKKQSLAKDVLQSSSGVPDISLNQVFGELSASNSYSSVVQLTKAYRKYGNTILTEDFIYNLEWNLDFKHVPTDPSKLSFKNLSTKFLAYYALAISPDSSKKREFSKALAINHGGNCKKSAALIEYLSLVKSSPYFFWSLDTLKDYILKYSVFEMMAQDEYFKRASKWNEFFSHMSKRTIAYHAAKQGVPLLQNCASQYVQSAMLSDIPLLSSIPHMQIPLMAAKLGGKVYNALQLRRAKEPSEVSQASVSSSGISYAFLKEDDVEVDLYLKGLFAQVFDYETQTKSLSVTKYETFKYSEYDSYAVKNRINRVNQSISDYYKRTSKGLVRLKENDHLWSIYSSLIKFKQEFKDQIEDELKQILGIINESIQDPRNKIQIRDLIKAYLNGDYTFIEEKSSVKNMSFAQLEQILSRHFVKTTRLFQIERIITAIDEVVKVDRSSSEYESKLEQLVTELQARRGYDFAELPIKLLKRFILFEYGTTKLIWEKQAESVKKLLVGPQGNYVLELIMSLGKTWFLIPYLNASEADGDALMFNAWTAGLAATNTKQTANQGALLFNQKTNSLSVNRHRPLDIDHLTAIYAMFQNARTEKETISITKEDMQSLALIFIDKLYQYRNGTNLQRKQLSEIILHIQSIRRLVKTKGKLIGDECHVLFNRKHELNYPLQQSSTVAERYYTVIEECLALLLEQEEFMSQLKKNSLPQFISKYQFETKTNLAKKIVESNRFVVVSEEQKNELIDYLLGQVKAVPQWILEHKQFKEMSMAKGVLNTLLPLALKSMFNVGFGRSIIHPKEEYARPYLGNKKPAELSSIANPYEAMVKTILLYFYSGLDEIQAQTLKDTLLKKAENEHKVRNIPLNQTPSYQKLISLSATMNLNEIQKHHQAAILYIRYHVRDQIKYWKKNIRQDALNFDSMFSQQKIYDSGTPYNDGSFPPDAEVLWDDGTIGEALHLIQERCPENGVHILNKSEPTQVLDEVLSKFFDAGSNFTALIDGGALLNGISNEEVAKKMMEFAVSKRPDIEAIVFFMPNKAGIDELVYMMKGSDQVFLFEQCKIPAEKRLSYFDQVHGFGADIPQKSNAAGLLLFGDDKPFYEVAQQAYRMRGIGRDKKIKTLFEGNSVQTIQFAMKGETAKLVSDKEIPAVHDLMHFSIKKEAEEVAEDNYHSYLQFVQNVVYTSADERLLFAEGIDELEKCFVEFEDILIAEKEDDPGKLYGLVESAVRPERVLEESRRNALARINKSSFDQQSKAIIQKKLDTLPIHVMPDTVQVFSEKGIIRVWNDLDKESQMVQAEMQEQASELEQDNEQQKQKQKELNLNVQSFGKDSYGEFTEWQWPKNLNVHSFDWLVMTAYNARKPNSQGVPLFNYTQSLADCGIEAFSKIAKAFDGRLWFSNNFIPRFTTSRKEEQVQIGSKNQRELFEVIVHAKEENNQLQILSVGCLSQKDMAFWRSKLENDASLNSGPNKVFLYDVKLRSAVAGSNVSSEMLRKDKALASLEVQLKFLNGDTIYEDEQVEALTKFIKFDPNDMKEAFRWIYNTQRGRQGYEGTILAEVFQTLIK